MPVRAFPDEPPYYAFTTIHDWTMFVGVSPQAHTLYLLLRSLTNDNRDPDAPKTILNDSALRSLIKKMTGRMPSVKSLLRWRDELAEAGLVSVVAVRGPDSSITSRIYQIRTLPAPGYSGPINALDALREVQKSELPRTARDEDL